jgi:hypothetical protein
MRSPALAQWAGGATAASGVGAGQPPHAAGASVVADAAVAAARAASVAWVWRWGVAGAGAEGGGEVGGFWSSAAVVAATAGADVVVKAAEAAPDGL